MGLPRARLTRGLFSLRHRPRASTRIPVGCYRPTTEELEASKDLYSDTTMQDGSPRLKRRRMLLFPASRDEGGPGDPAMDASMECMECMESHIENCAGGGSMMPPCEEFERLEVPAPSSPNSLWYLRNDESHFIMDEALEPAASDKWMSRCFVEIQGHQQVVPVSEISGTSGSGSCSINQQQQECEFEFSESPSISFGGPFTPGSRSTVQYTKPKSVTPVAYPFNLLKPSRAQGDVTLTDINQRLSMPPSRPSQFSVDKRLVQAGAGGLSGKSVVHRTKIHTQGDGCITIMRTRG
ncbi:hypothetical protein Mapa_003905 [Marchantia paleacea]|nr:hypothetical protein Mapa_003905 [Marchantia paleacea]